VGKGPEGERESYPGNAIIPLQPVPGDRVAVAMYTAHRISDMAEELAHTAERVAVSVNASPQLRAHHLVHVRNHLVRVIDNAHLLAGSVRRHYPREARELGALNQTIGLAVAVSPAAKAATFAHLLETVLYHAAHAKRHAETADPAREKLWAFDCTHLARHVKGAAEHVTKLRQHVLDNYPAEAGWLRKLHLLAQGDQAALDKIMRVAAGG
jgi:hypothetical protein